MPGWNLSGTAGFTPRRTGDIREACGILCAHIPVGCLAIVDSRQTVSCEIDPGWSPSVDPSRPPVLWAANSTGGHWWRRTREGAKGLHHVKNKHIVVRRKPKNTLGLPDLDQTKSAVLNSLPSKESHRVHPPGAGHLHRRHQLGGRWRSGPFGSARTVFRSGSPGVTPGEGQTEQGKHRWDGAGRLAARQMFCVAGGHQIQVGLV